MGFLWGWVSMIVIMLVGNAVVEVGIFHSFLLLTMQSQVVMTWFYCIKFLTLFCDTFLKFLKS